jgi:hypothetical protein
MEFKREPEYNVIVVGYPRSGNTWLSRLLGDVLDSPVTGIYNAKPLAEEGLDRHGKYVVRQLHLHPVWAECEKAFISGTEFCVEKRTKEKIICIVRDPRDVCVSVMHYWDLETIEEAYEAMTEGAPPMKGAGTWNSFITDWIKVSMFLRAKGQQRIPWVRYEDLKKSPQSVLTLLLKKLDLFEYDYDVRIKGASERQEFKARQAEIKTSPHRFNYGKTIQLKSMRKGIVGDWRNFFSEELAQMAEGRWGNLMEEFYYK